MCCPSCRHALTGREQTRPEYLRGGARYCTQCLGGFYRGGHWAASDWSIEQYWDDGREPPMVVRQAGQVKD